MRISWATVCKTVAIRPLSVLSVCLSVCDVGVLWPDGWVDQDATLRQMVTQSPQNGHSPSPKFSAHACCVQTDRWIKMPLGTEVGLNPCHIVLDDNPASLEKGGSAPFQFFAHVCCGQTPGWITMPLGTEVGLDPGHIVLDGDPVTPNKGAQDPPILRLMSIVAKRLDGSRGYLVTWYGGKPRSRRHCVRWGPSSPSKKERRNTCTFCPMSIVAKRLYGSGYYLVRR